MALASLHDRELEAVPWAEEQILVPVFECSAWITEHCATASANTLRPGAKEVSFNRGHESQRLCPNRCVGGSIHRGLPPPGVARLAFASLNQMPVDERLDFRPGEAVLRVGIDTLGQVRDARLTQAFEQALRVGKIPERELTHSVNAAEFNVVGIGDKRFEPFLD